MTRAKREALVYTIVQLGIILNKIEAIKNEEQDSIDRKSDNPRFDDEILDMELAVESMDQSMISIREAIKDATDNLLAVVNA